MIPLRTDRRLKHTPWVNITLIVVNALVFLGARQQIAGLGTYGSMLPPQALAREFPIVGYFLDPAAPHWWQYLTYQFLHANGEHLIFNMLFLYVFGNSLEDRFGPVGYLFYYLAGGVVAGLGHTLSSTHPVLGASGAVSAVTGGFLALFPRSSVTILWPFLFIFVTEWPSMYFILFAFARDVFYEVTGRGEVAYLAHISGNLFGFTVGMAMLFSGLLPREPYDFLALADRWNRRRKFRSIAAQGPSPWHREAAQSLPGPQLSEPQVAAVRLAAGVEQALRDRRDAQAIAAFEQLLQTEPTTVLPRQVQLDIAALAMHEGRYETAARAYEMFLRAYPSDPAADEVHLVLGLIYGRYLGDPDRAIPPLEHARARHPDPARRAMAQSLLSEMS